MASRTGTALVRNWTTADVQHKVPVGVINSATLAIPELQGLRAVGCCLVFLAHALIVVFPGRFMGSIDVPAGELLARAVIGFFILSGLVLALPYVSENSRPFNLRHFYFERLLRLYPAYLVSVVFALGMRLATSKWVGLSAISPWAQNFWSLPLTARSLIEHVFAFAIQSRNLNPVYWTMTLEIQACLLFPMIIFLVRRTRHWSLAPLPIAALIILSHFFPQGLLIRTISYFMMGAYVAKYNFAIKKFLRELPASAVVVILLGLCIFFYMAPRIPLSYRLSFIVLDCLLGLSMVAVQAFQPLSYVANLRPVQRLADISYCFYLFHLPLLAASTFALFPVIHSAALTILAAVSLTLLVASCAHRFIESPIRRWAKARLHRSSGKEYVISDPPSPELAAATAESLL